VFGEVSLRHNELGLVMKNTMNLKLRLLAGLMLACFLLTQVVVAQSDSDAGISLGDLARSLRKKKDLPKEAPVPTVIDNDNLTQVMNEAETRKLSGQSVLYSIDDAGKGFKVSSPDVTCSLSFSAQATPLLSDPFVSRELPAGELLKLDGPASIKGNALEINVYNGTSWSLREITVGLTIVRHASTDPSAAKKHLAGRLIPAAAIDPVAPSSSEKRSDLTLLYHLKGSAPPSTTTVFRETLGGDLTSDQDWHWAIVQAKGIPPEPKLPD
jgi:hypothetical protein